MNEYDLIRRITKQLPRGTSPDAGLFGCDAEIVRIGNETWGLTIDEFTPEEDRFTSHDAVLLGRNLATATLSDLLAAGMAPRFFLSALSLPASVALAFVDDLTRGLGAVLTEAGCLHSGGDLGVAEPWRFTGFAMGNLAAAQPLTHRVPASPQALCVTGTLGDLNLAAFLNAPTPPIELRLREAALIWKTATACIDTSGGFFDALWLLHQQSPGLRFTVDVPTLPLAPAARHFAEQAKVPPAAFFLGGAGEYELLFTVPADQLSALKPELDCLGISVVGEITPGEGSIVLRSQHGERRMATPPPSPRDAPTPADHAAAVIQRATELLA